MGSTTGSKYVASGFDEDSSKLLNEFIERSTTEFSEFAEIWRKHSFSLIFMGRPDYTETCEFVNEIFKKTTHFLSSPSFYQQVGAVYLLYGLFRNQISEPTIKIRIEINQWRIIKSLLIEAKLKNFKTLHYVIDYLIENAFIYVAHQNIKGPLIGFSMKTSKEVETIRNMKATYKSEILNYSASKDLEKLRDVTKQYQEMKQLVKDKANIPVASGTAILYENFITDLQGLINPSERITKKTEDVGSRRAKIKAKSFFLKTRDRFGNLSEDTNGYESEPDKNIEDTTWKIGSPQKTKRKPKSEKKLGRPRKKPMKVPSPSPPKSDDEIDISHLVPQQQDFYLPPVESETKKIRIRRNPYYKVPMKQEDDDSSN